MSHPIRLAVVTLAGITLSISNMSAEARGGGRGGAGGRGGFAGGGGGVQRAPSNYGSLRSSSPSGGGFNQPGLDANNYRGQSSSFDTRRGGEGTVGVTPGGNVAVRGETAGGYNYAGVQGPGGNRVVASQTPSGDVAVRHRDAGDGVINDLPNGYDTVYYDGNPYYYYDHQYYWPYYYGGEVYYQEVYAPPGATTTNLPDTYATAEIDGKTYYLYDGVYYVKQGDNYVVVPSPVGAAAATNAPPPAPATPDPRSFLKAMSDYMGTCTSFQIQTTETTESPQSDGSMGESEVKRNILIQQPDHLTAAARIGSAVNRFWYDGETATIYQQAKGVYSNVKAPGGNAVMLNLLHDIYGMTVPLADILMPGLLESLEPRIKSMRYNGTGTAAGVLCNKIVIVTGDFQAQLWIEASEKTPRPRMLEVIYTSEPGQPHYEATIDSWEDQPEIKEGIFTFTPPPNATKIQMVPVGSGG